MCDIVEREVGRFPPPTLDVSDGACSIASLARLSYLKIIYRYLSRLYVVAISYEYTVTATLPETC